MKDPQTEATRAIDGQEPACTLLDSLLLSILSADQAAMSVVDLRQGSASSFIDGPPRTVL